MTHRDPDDPTALDAPLDDDLRALIARAESRPTLRPSRDLWPEIAARLDARSDVPSDARQDAHPEPRVSNGSRPSDARVLAFRARDEDTRRDLTSSRPIPRRWLAAAAVALAVVSSGATYLAMRPTDARLADAQTAAPRPTTVAAGASTTVPAPVTSNIAMSATGPTLPPAAVGRDEPRGVTLTHPSVRAVSRSVDASVPGAADYDREIAALRAVVVDGQGDLDSTTVDVLARNLRIIDAAIAASRAALARDPRSPFLGEQLTRALGQKVDLLRTAALLPRT